MQLTHLKEGSSEGNHDRTHNAQPLPELYPGQDVLFLSPSKCNSYIQGTIVSPAYTPRSYIIQCKGRQFHRTRQQICPLHHDTPPPFQDYMSSHLQHKLQWQSCKKTQWNQQLQAIPRPQASKCTSTPNKCTAASHQELQPTSHDPRPQMSKGNPIWRPLTPNKCCIITPLKTISPCKLYAADNGPIFSPPSSSRWTTANMHSDPNRVLPIAGHLSPHPSSPHKVNLAVSPVCAIQHLPPKVTATSLPCQWQVTDN